ncbi:Hypothetical predicted protein [Mytilus galloprovincialis]|uniref:Uncharacterized protein n=1 Tax=Mytilus galloprovincialis TaxID=29158 RepID=A0A8B6E803_MYTGA|nr:Hypothetical predicted protein [Mytilus galloprovincialis]
MAMRRFMMNDNTDETINDDGPDDENDNADYGDEIIQIDDESHDKNYTADDGNDTIKKTMVILAIRTTMILTIHKMKLTLMIRMTTSISDITMQNMMGIQTITITMSFNFMAMSRNRTFLDFKNDNTDDSDEQNTMCNDTEDNVVLFLTDKNDTANDCDDCDTDDDGEHDDTDNKVEYGFIYMEECGNHEGKNDNIDNGDNTIQMMIVILAIMIIMFFVTISIRRHRR